MKIKNYLNNLKKDYLKTEPRERFLSLGWQDLQNKINRLDRPKTGWANVYFRPFAFIMLTIFILGGAFAGLAQASQGALPGEPLYPVKRWAENVVSLATGNNIIKVDNRAREIVDLSKKGQENSTRLRQSVSEYKEEVSEATRSGKNTTLIQNKLENHEEEFKKVESESRDGQIREAIQVTEDSRHGGRQEEDHSGKD